MDIKKRIPIIAGLACALVIAGVVVGITVSRSEPQSTLPNDYQGNNYDQARQQQEAAQQRQQQEARQRQQEAERRQQEESCKQREQQRVRQRQREYSKLYDEWMGLQRQIESLQSEIQMLEIELNGKYQLKAACIEAHANDEPTGTWLDINPCGGYDSAINYIRGQIGVKQREIDRLRSQADRIRLAMERLK